MSWPNWAVILLLGMAMCLIGVAYWEGAQSQNIYYEGAILNIFRTYPIDHYRPWNNLSIQDKMVLCAYGSSGNKLSKQDMKEIADKYQVN